MKFLIFFSFIIFAVSSAHGQKIDTDSLLYYEMPPAPEDFRPGNVLTRMVDGLGYRFYWATKGLRSEDLRYRPTNEARSTAETIDHIFSMTIMILNATEGIPNTRRDASRTKLSWSEKREQTLNNLIKTSQLLVGKDEDELAAMRIAFSDENGTSELPYWNIINGPLADAIYHTGQIVSFRRISGNPMSPKVNVFRGKNRP